MFVALAVQQLVCHSSHHTSTPALPPSDLLCLQNGRAAMIGFAALLVVEAVRGTALF